MWAKKFGALNQLFLKFGVCINRMGRLYKENIHAEQGRRQSVTIENSKQFALKTENAQQKN